MSQKSGKKHPFAKLLALLLVVGAASYVIDKGKDEPTQAAAKPPPAKVVPRKAAPVALRYTDNPSIIKLANPLPAVRGKDGKTTINPKGITLHWWSLNSGGDIQGLVRALRTNTACGRSQGCTVQFGITQKTGNTYQMMRSPKSFAQHAHGANNTTVGIEIEGGNEDFVLPGKKGFDQNKFVATVNLVAKLMKEYKIPLNGKVTCDNVVGVHAHREYNKCGNDKDDVSAAYTKAVKDAVKNMQR